MVQKDEKIIQLQILNNTGVNAEGNKLKKRVPVKNKHPFELFNNGRLSRHIRQTPGFAVSMLN